MKSLWQWIQHRGVQPGLARMFCLALSWLLGSAALAAVPPAITNITVLPNRAVQLHLVVEAGQSYTFEISTDLVHWQAVGGLEKAPTNFLSVVDEQTVDQSLRRFYRMREGRYQRFSFGLMHFARPGQFAVAALTPTVTYPVSYHEYSATFEVEGDAPYPLPSEVFFTGPTGSGLSSAAAATDNSSTDEFGAWFQSPVVSSSSGAPLGTWTVTYRGTNKTFTAEVPPLTRLVLPVPTVVVANGMVSKVDWVYRDRMTGDALSSPPAYMESIQLQMEGAAGRLYESPYDVPPTVTSHVFTSPVPWSEVRAVSLAYDDTADSHYVISFSRE